MAFNFVVLSGGGAYSPPSTALNFWIRDLTPGAPVVDAAGFSVSEGAAIGDAVGTVTAVDPNADPISFAITAGNTGTAFAINSSTGAITVAAALDFDSHPSYSLTITASDGTGRSGSATITITITEVQEAPVVTPASFSISEAASIGTVVGTITGSDANGDTLSWSITAGNTGTAFAIDSGTGVITVAAALDFDTLADYALTVTANDGTGRSGSATIDIEIEELQEAPVVTPASFSISEAASIGTVVGTITGSDANGDTLSWSITAGNTGTAFAIDSGTGVITVAAALDFDALADYALTVTADDGTGRSGSATIDIEIEQVPEAPVVTPASFSISEIASVGTEVGTATGSDANGDTLSWSITAGNTGTAFAIDSSTGVITVAAALDFDTLASYALTVTADDGTGRSGSATVDIEIIEEQATPVVDDASFSVSEAAGVGTTVGTVTASDANGDPLVFAITAGNSGGAFAIDSSTGVITVAATLDFESLDFYSLTVSADDGTARIGYATISIDVLDVPEVVLEPAPSHILRVRLPWAGLAATDRSTELPWYEARVLDLSVELPYVDAPARDLDTELVWVELRRLDLQADLAWKQSDRLVDAVTDLCWHDPPVRDLPVSLGWDERWVARDALTTLTWRDPPAKDQLVSLLYREVDLVPPQGDWYSEPIEVQSGAGIDLAWTRQLNFTVRLNDPYSQPNGALNFQIPVLPPVEPMPPVLIVWAPFRAPQLRPIAVDHLHSLPWSISPAKDRLTTLRWGRGQPVSSPPVELPWESELPEPTWIVVPPLRAYNVANSTSVVRLPERTPINPLAVSVRWDDASYAWQLTMTLFSAAEMALLSPLAGVREVEVTINGWVIVAAIESYSRSRQFPKTTWTVQGRSRQCYLDEPYSRPRSLVSTSEASAEQLALDELPSGWSLDWDVPDWIVPAGAWSYDELTPVKAIGRLAAAAGAVLQPDPQAKKITVRSRYPISPSGWAAATPFATVPEAICTNMGESYRAGETRNAVIVEGATQGVRVEATRTGTAGDDPLPSITEQLCTAVECGLERARVELDATGATIDQTIALPVLPSLGVVLPGRLLEVQDTPATWRGLVRALELSSARSKEGLAIGQMLSIERRAA